MKAYHSLRFHSCPFYCSSQPFLLRKRPYIVDRTKTRQRKVDGREMHELHHSVLSWYLFVLPISTRKVVLSRMSKGVFIPVSVHSFVSFRSKRKSKQCEEDKRKGEQEKHACPKLLLLFVLHLLLSLPIRMQKKRTRTEEKKTQGSGEKHLCLSYPPSSLITLFQKLWKRRLEHERLSSDIEAGESFRSTFCSFCYLSLHLSTLRHRKRGAHNGMNKGILKYGRRGYKSKSVKRDGVQFLLPSYFILSHSGETRWAIGAERIHH